MTQQVAAVAARLELDAEKELTRRSDDLVRRRHKGTHTASCNVRRFRSPEIGIALDQRHQRGGHRLLAAVEFKTAPLPPLPTSWGPQAHIGDAWRQLSA
jgi:hypothetical protein